MKLLYITNGINGAGGLERVLSIKASKLADDLGYEVSILVLNNANTDCFYEFSPNIKMLSINVSGNPLQYWKSYKDGIKKTVAELQPDIISVCDDGLKAFFVPKILNHRKGIIYERHVSKLIDAHSADSWMKKLRTKIVWNIMDQKAKSFDKFVVLTEGNKKEWPNLTNILSIANPVSFYPAQTSSLDQKTVICVGKIAYQKGQDLLVKAWDIVHRRFPDWKLQLYGKENLNILDTHHLPEGVDFFPPEKNIQEKYLDSAIYVMASRYEGFGMVLTEAMACGVPCVSFNCDYGPSDIITDGVDGFLAEKENVRDLADKLMALMQDDAKRKEMGSKARASVSRYLPDTIAAEWDHLFREITA